MIRTHIYFAENQLRRLQAKARDRGVSLSALIREYVEQGLATERPDRAALYDRAMRMVGKFTDREGKRDVSRRHDHYLDEAFASVGRRSH